MPPDAVCCPHCGAPVGVSQPDDDESEPARSDEVNAELKRLKKALKKLKKMRKKLEDEEYCDGDDEEPAYEESAYEEPAYEEPRWLRKVFYGGAGLCLIGTILLFAGSDLGVWLLMAGGACFAVAYYVKDD